MVIIEKEYREILGKVVRDAWILWANNKKIQNHIG